MAQSVKCFLCRHEDLRLIPRIHVKTRHGGVACSLGRILDSLGSQSDLFGELQGSETLFQTSRYLVLKE